MALEYTFIDKKDICDECLKKVTQFIESLEIEDKLKGDAQMADVIETVAFWLHCEDEDGVLDLSGLRDYDYAKGIADSEYANSIVEGFDVDEESIFGVGKLTFILVRTKENSTTLPSQTFVIKCWL